MNKKDRIPSYDIRYSLFRVSFSDQTAAFQASRWAEPRTSETLNPKLGGRLVDRHEF